MPYYYPIGNSAALTVQNIDYAFSAVTASVILSTTVVPTASFATSVTNSPPAGNNGTNVDPATCTATAPTGDPGAQGPRGSDGPDATTCPPNTKECPGLFVSLSMVNANRPSGSQFSIVCLDVTGYIESTIGCPDYLPVDAPTYTLPTIPT